MHNFNELLIFDTVEEGQKKLNRMGEIRDSMGGALYWNIANEDYLEILSKLNELKNKLLRIKKTLDGISIKVIESYIRTKKLKCLDSTLNSNENGYLGYYILDDIELKYIEDFLNEYKKNN